MSDFDVKEKRFEEDIEDYCSFCKRHSGGSVIMITLRVSGLFCILSSVYRKKKVSEYLPWKVVYSETWSL